MCYTKSVSDAAHTLAVFTVQIWFIGRTPASQAGKAGSIPVICSQVPHKWGVAGSTNSYLVKFLWYLESVGLPIPKPHIFSDIM